MGKKELFFCLIAGLLLSGSARYAVAQQWRPVETFYLRPRLGVSTYTGDRADGGLGSGPLGPSTGLEVGYRTRLGPIGGNVGLYFLAGRYPALIHEVPGTPAIRYGELEVWRHTLGLVGRLGLRPEARLNPYLQVGAGATGGVVDGAFKVAFTPLGGVGLDVGITDQVGIFIEATVMTSLPDRRLDLAAGVDDQGADWFGFFGGGVRIGLNDPFAPVRVLGIEGPTRLETGEVATFTARANVEGATGPITYRWQFEDGAEAAGQTITRRFERPGNYTLTLVVSNEGSVDRRPLTVTVAAPASAEASPAPQESQEPSTGVSQPADVPADTAGMTTVRFADKAPQDESSVEQAPARQAAASISCEAIIDLNATYFEENSAALSAEGRRALRENIEVLEQCPALDVRLETYVVPGADDAQALANARAGTVERFYLRHGIAAARITGADLNAVDDMSIKIGLGFFYRVDTVPVDRVAVSER